MFFDVSTVALALARQWRQGVTTDFYWGDQPALMGDMSVRSLIELGILFKGRSLMPS